MAKTNEKTWKIQKPLTKPVIPAVPAIPGKEGGPDHSFKTS